MAVELEDFDVIAWTVADEARPAVDVGEIPAALSERAQRVLRTNARLRGVFDGTTPINGDNSDSGRAYRLAIVAGQCGLEKGDAARLVVDFYGQPGKKRLHRVKLEKTLRGWAKGREEAEREDAGVPREHTGVDVDAAPSNGNEHASENAPRCDPNPIILDAADPVPSPRTFVARTHTIQNTLALRHQGGLFYAYEPAWNAYADQDEAAIRAELYGFLESAQRWAESKGSTRTLIPYKPTKSRMENVLDALRAVTNLSTSSAAPCCLQGDPGLDPFDLLACRNGLLHVPTRTLLPGTPAFFTLTGLSFAYNPKAPVPTHWLKFLTDLWPNDPECRDTLQEIVGYTLTPRTVYQKIFMLVGPKRSGKGTIGRVVRCLLGDHNVCGPALGNMGEQFGLSILIGKSLAIIADARISGRTDTAILTERLLSISGEDTLSIPRKYLPDWTGKLPTRFLLLTNELPRIEDASGALASRFIVLTLSQSFYGREDHGLFARFLPELPGILNWALAGWDRLYARGHFVQPKASTELFQQFADLGSPISAFVHECCEIGPGYEVAQASLFNTWKTWCEANGRDRPGTTQRFGRDLRSAFPWLTSSRPRDDGERIRCWIGLRLRA